MQKMLIKLPVITLIAFLMFGAFVGTVKADGQTATRTETVCDTGAYGVQNCHQVVEEIPTHVVAETALPNVNVVAAALLVTLLLSGAAYLYTK